MPWTSHFVANFIKSAYKGTCRSVMVMLFLWHYVLWPSTVTVQINITERSVGNMTNYKVKHENGAVSQVRPCAGAHLNTNMHWCTSEYKQTAQVYLNGLIFWNWGFKSSHKCQDGTRLPFWKSISSWQSWQIDKIFLITAMKTSYHVNIFKLLAADAKLFGWNTPHIV